MPPCRDQGEALAHWPDPEHGAEMRRTGPRVLRLGVAEKADVLVDATQGFFHSTVIDHGAFAAFQAIPSPFSMTTRWEHKVIGNRLLLR
jgi:hypothetical protein